MLLPPYNIDPAKLLQEYKVRLIAIDRLGNGLSSFNPTGTFLSNADDVMYLLDHLNITSAKVLCWSGGGPFALAVASKYSQRVTGVYVIAGFTASFNNAAVFKNMYANKYYFGTAKKLPGLVRIVMTFLSRKQIRKPLTRIVSGLPKVDHELMKDTHQFQTLASVSLREPCLQGSKGPVYEAGMYFNDFGFDISSVTRPIRSGGDRKIKM